MAWMRFTLVTPAEGAHDEVLDLLNDLEGATAGLPGFLQGGVFVDSEASNRVGRFALWATREDADKASVTDRVMSIRSRLHLIIEPGHLESLFEMRGANNNMPG